MNDPKAYKEITLTAYKTPHARLIPISNKINPALFLYFSMDFAAMIQYLQYKQHTEMRMSGR